MADEKITLGDLKGDHVVNSVKEVSAADIAGTVKKEETYKPDPLIANALTGLDAALERTKQEMQPLKDAAMKEMLQEQLDKEEAKKEEEMKKDNDSIPETPVGEDKSVSGFTFLDIDLDDDNYEPEYTAEEKQQLEDLKAVIKQNIKPINNVVDINQFKIAKKAVNVNKILNVSEVGKRVADWVLLTTQRAVSMSELSGQEIESFNPRNTARNRINTYKEMFSIMYNHLVDDNKPTSLEAWVKTLIFFDIEHLYFTMYRACFEGSNYITYTCPKCKHVQIELKEIAQMIKYTSDTVKEKVAKILSKDTTSFGDLYTTEPIQVSDNYMIAFKIPSVYNVIFENAALDEEFTEKYNKILGIMSYIDEIYYIDRNSMELVPVDTMPVPTDLTKTVKNKIKIYNTIFKTLNSDQHNNIIKEINKINETADGVKYVIPETNCEKCGSIIKEEERDALSLIFTRHQLVGIANLSEK
jgi:predicted Zn-ribbon and HTH transcriptional regulator